MKLTSPIFCLAVLLASGQHASPAAALTLSAVLARVELENPRLAAFQWELKAAEARVLQASLRPNPELSLEIEDFRLGGGGDSREQEEALGLAFGDQPPLSLGIARSNGSDHTGRLEGAEITLSFAQLIELGGKRASRISFASAEQEAAALDYELLRAEILADAAQAFVDVLAAQQELALAEQLLALMQETEETVRLRAEAGKIPPLELKRLRVERLLVNNSLLEHHSALHARRLALAAFWGQESDEFGMLQGDFHRLEPLPPLNLIQEQVAHNPEIQRWAAETQVRRARHALEQAQAVPDLTVRAGVRTQGAQETQGSGWQAGTDGLTYWRNRNDGDERNYSLVLEVAMPIPVFHRNQGAVLEAEHLVAQGEAESAAAAASVRATLAQLHGKLTAAGQGLRQLEQEVIPLAAESVEGTRLGYREGKLGLLDVLESERTRAEAELRRVRLLADFHKDRIAMERLLGQSLAGGIKGEEPVASPTVESHSTEDLKSYE